MEKQHPPLFAILSNISASSEDVPLLTFVTPYPHTVDKDDSATSTSLLSNVTPIPQSSTLEQLSVAPCTNFMNTLDMIVLTQSRCIYDLSTSPPFFCTDAKSVPQIHGYPPHLHPAQLNIPGPHVQRFLHQTISGFKVWTFAIPSCDHNQLVVSSDLRALSISPSSDASSDTENVPVRQYNTPHRKHRSSALVVKRAGTEGSINCDAWCQMQVQYATGVYSQ